MGKVAFCELCELCEECDVLQVLERFVPKITHENDGLILNPLEDVCLCCESECVRDTECLWWQAYQAGQCPAVLKWKPPNLNSVDFRLSIVEDDREGYTHTQHTHPHTRMHLHTHTHTHAHAGCLKKRWVSYGSVAITYPFLDWI